MPGGFVERLRSELTDRLHDLDREAAAIKHALAALEEDRRNDPRPARRTPALDDRLLLAEVRCAPGVRASVIALSKGWSADVVIARLRRLEAASRVERH